MKAKYLLATVESIADAVRSELSGVVETIAEQLGRDDDLVPVRKAIDKGVRSARRGLRAH